MTGELEKKIRQQQMASLGSLLADFSHEMRNHLAVMQEANGLLEDILVMEKDKGNPLLTSVEETVVQIGKRVQSSAELCRYLSSMAHRSDTPLSSFQVNDLLSELIVFLKRSARSRQTTVQLEPGQGIEPIYNEPALLQSVLYQLYAFSAEHLHTGHTLFIRTAPAAEGVAIMFCLNDVPQSDLSGLPERVSAAVSSLGAGLEELKRGGERGADYSGFRLLVPSLASVG